MSQFTSTTQNVHARREMQNERTYDRFEAYNPNGRWAPHENGFLWPSSRMFGAATGSEVVPFGQDAGNTGRWGVQNMDDGSGGQQMLKISGTTRDANGDPLPFCTIQGFLTGDDTYVRAVVSDMGGNYVFTTQYTAAHYLVAYKADSPDVAGTSVNTLTGS